MDLIVSPPIWTPSWANGVLHDMANAWMAGVWPDPSPQVSPLSLLRKFPFGSLSGWGEASGVWGVLAALWLYQAEVVAILNVEPGGNVVCVALFSSGLGTCARRVLSFLINAFPLWVA